MKKYNDDLEKAGITKPERDVQVTDFFKTGVKFSRFGDAHDDPESMILKRKQLLSGADAYSKGLGDRIYYVQYFDEKQEPITAPITDDDGNLIMPDTEDGKFRKVNETWYDANMQALKEFEKRVDDEMEDRVFSDQLNATVMGLSMKKYLEILQPNGGMDGMTDEMKKVDGRVSTIRATPPGIEQTRMLSKLRFLVSTRLTNIKKNKVRASTTSRNVDKVDVTDQKFTRETEVKAQVEAAK